MDYRFTDEHRLFRDTVRAFCQEQLGPLVAEAERTETFPRDRVLPAMAELGLFGIGVPEDRGGVGGDTVMLCIAAEEIARVCGGFAIATMLPLLAGSVLMKLGTPEQQAERLPPLLEGTVMPAMGLTEPGAGSDLFSLRTTAQRDGDTYVLNGSKTFISNGPTADTVIVAAVLAEQANARGLERAMGINLFMVDRGTPGFEAPRKLEKMGLKSCETGELAFTDCRIPAEHRIGGPDVNFITVMQVLDFTRLYIAALSLGIAEAALEATVAYSKERVTFGKPIARHQSIAFRLARMATQLEAARLLIYQGATLYDQGEPCTREVSMAKLFATEAAEGVTAEALHIHGGYGYMTEYPVERYFRDAKVGPIWEGSSEVQCMLIARELGLYA